MENNIKQDQPFIYDRSTKARIPVSEAVHSAYYTEAGYIRGKEHDCGHCICPEESVWMCDGDCLDCEFHRMDENLSLDALIESREGTFLDAAAFAVPSIEDVITNRDLLERISTRFRELDPDAETIISLWCEDFKISDQAIAKILGRPPHIFVEQMKKYRAVFRRICDG